MLTVSQIAKDLNVCTKTVYRRIWSGELPVHKIGNGCVRIDEAEYQKYKDGLRQQSITPHI